MRITSVEEVNSVVKPSGDAVDYYLFDDYEVHMNVQPPHSEQEWHRHEHIREVLVLYKGSLLAKWEVGDEVREQTLKPGDHVDTGREMHTFANVSDQPAHFFVIKMMDSGKNYREVFKTDKVTRDSYVQQ